MTTTERCTCTRCRVHDTGKVGPFTPSEMMAMTLPQSEESIDVDPEVITRAARVDEVLVMYNAAEEAWRSATRDLRAVRGGHHSQSDLRDAEDIENLARRSRDRFADELGAARVAYTNAAQADQRARAHAIYEAGQEVLRAARESAQQDESPRGLLKRIKRRVSA